ncbi:MAG: hypothetical protein PHY57_10940 [Ignavibacterium sp.]|nr:hypothetical protein [Ignavibacteriaceae bacterium]MDD5609020.1 hypothetical protein [Ignavibacterium sp.]
MTDFLTTPEELDSNNSIENNNNNILQNNSEENTKKENVERQTPKHFSGLSDITPEEEERRMQDEDRELWEHINEEEETNSAGSEEEKTDVVEQLNQSTGRRHYKKDNLTIAGLKRIQNQKRKKVSRLTQENSKMKADLDRGYLIVPLAEGSENVKHIKLNKSDREIIEAAIAYNEFDKYETGLDIGEIEQRIIDLASRKKSSYKDKLSKKKANLKESELVKRVDKELDKASKNGSKEIVSRIQQQVQSGNKNDAYNSLKSFLSQQVKTVAKKLDKDEKLEKNVLDRVIDKLSAAQS